MNNEIIKPVVDREITKELQSRFLDYAVSVIVARALPDLRDGLKPVHRRILYAMYRMGIFHNQAYKKSARVVGEVIGKYHPHGDQVVYSSLARMAQSFSLRYPLIDGHGNWGSIDGDAPAAMRYTEVRLTKIASELFGDCLDKETVTFKDNYDVTETEPTLLPSILPTLLLNGSTGIAVSMATSIPPHNLTEIIDATIALIKDPNLSISTLVNDYIHGPDFPTGGYLIPTPELLRAYETGQGFATLRAKTEVIKLPSGNAALIINEIPYQLKKSDLVTKIAGLIESKKIEHVSTLRDESNRLGIRIVIEFKRREEQFVNSVLKKLYKYTPLQTRFSMNFVVLNNNRPETCNLKTLLQHYIEFQLLIINKRTRFDLKKKEEQHHIMAGLMMALENIDPIITLIRESSDVKSALHSLKNQYHFSEKQAKAILEMRLQRLVSLEKAKIVAETLALQQQINELKHLLESKEVQINSLIDQLQRLKHEYGSERNTVLLQEELEEITDAELIPQEAILITLSQHDYIKRCPLSTYRLQLKGGVGVRGLTFKDNDALKQTLVTSTHDKLLFFSNKGKCYALAGYELPSFSREARGIPLINILPLTKDEKIPTILAIRQFELNQSLLFVTKNGIVKKTLLSAYQTVQKNGKIAISLKEDDELITVLLITENNAEVFLATDNGFVVRFKAADLRLLQRSGMGVKGVNVKEGNVISACIRTHEPYLLTISEKGLGKITNCELYRLTRRAAKGVKSLKVTSRTGKLIAIKALIPSKTELLLYTNDGMIEWISSNKIRITTRNTQGIKLISLSKKNQKIVNVESITD